MRLVPFGNPAIPDILIIIIIIPAGGCGGAFRLLILTGLLFLARLGFLFKFVAKPGSLLPHMLIRVREQKVKHLQAQHHVRI